MNAHRAFSAVFPGGLRISGSSGILSGLKLSVKDNFMVQGHECSAASHVLDRFVAPYTATVVERALKAGAEVIGKTNMDEFGMG